MREAYCFYVSVVSVCLLMLTSAPLRAQGCYGGGYSNGYSNGYSYGYPSSYGFAPRPRPRFRLIIQTRRSGLDLQIQSRFGNGFPRPFAAPPGEFYYSPAAAGGYARNGGYSYSNGYSNGYANGYPGGYANGAGGYSLPQPRVSESRY